MKVYKIAKNHSYSNWGNRCKSFSKGCIVCDAYLHLLIIKRFPYTLEELWDWQKSEVYINEPEENKWEVLHERYL